MSRCEGNREENGSDEVMVVFGSIQGDGRKLNETGLAAELLFDIVRIRSADLLRLSIYRRNGENGLAFCPLRMMAYVVSGSRYIEPVDDGFRVAGRNGQVPNAVSVCIATQREGQRTPAAGMQHCIESGGGGTIGLCALP